MDAAVVKKIDKLAGKRGRSTFIRRAVRQALDQGARWESIESALGAIADSGHEWDTDPADWVHRSRRSDRRRVG